MALSQYLENKLINATVGNVSYTTPATVYLALYSVPPTANTSGTELSSNGYSRQTVTFGSAANGSASSTNTVTFGPATANWSPIVGSAVTDASSGGNILYFAGIAAAQVVLNGSSLVLGTGNVTVSLT